VLQEYFEGVLELFVYLTLGKSWWDKVIPPQS
jgi:hypothetical protein